MRVQAYSKHDTGVFHAWYMCIPCVIQAYSMRSTGAFHDTGIFHSCVHTRYSYRHILITLGQSTCTYTCCKHKALCSCIGKYALYRYIDTGIRKTDKGCWHLWTCIIIMRDLEQLLHNFYSKGIHILSPKKLQVYEYLSSVLLPTD